MFPFVSGLNQEQVNACFKIINDQRKLNEKLSKLKKERETDESRLAELKKLMADFLKNPRLSFKSCLYYNYLLTEHNKLKAKLDESKKSENNDQDISNKEEETKATTINTDEERGWYNSYLKIF